jgi:hypothetical protein
MAAPAGKWELEPSDRRLTRRFPIGMAAQYKLLRYGRVVNTGEGRTLNLSSGGALIWCEGALPKGHSIELSLLWPVRLDGRVGMSLEVAGTTVRATGNTVAVAFSRHYFRTRNLRAPDSIAIPGSENCVRTIARPMTLRAAGE